MTSPPSACSHAMCCPVYLTIWTLHPEVAQLDFVGIFSFHIFGPSSSAKDCFISILILLFRSLDQFLGQISTYFVGIFSHLWTQFLGEILRRLLFRLFLQPLVYFVILSHCCCCISTSLIYKRCVYRLPFVHWSDISVN